MKIAEQRITCKKCKHVFDSEIVLEAPIAVTIASMNAIRCPACGSDEAVMGGAYDDAPEATSSIEQRAAWWIKRGDTGTSSLTIWAAFTGGINPHVEDSWPHDPDDFQRCKKLLDLIPEWRGQLAVVTKIFPWLKPFTDRWDKFESLWEKEFPSGRCPKLYREMKIAAVEAKMIRYGKSFTNVPD